MAVVLKLLLLFSDTLMYNIRPSGWSCGTMAFLAKCSRRHAIDCFCTYLTHVQTCDYVRVLRNWLLLYMPYTCPNLWLRSCSQCFVINCFCTCLTHVQTCDYVRVHSASYNWLLLYMPYTCPNLWLRSCSQCFVIDCFCTCLTHVQTCDYVRVRSATQLTASVHTLHMSKPVITLVVTAPRNWLLLYIHYTCPNLWLRSCSS